MKLHTSLFLAALLLAGGLHAAAGENLLNWQTGWAQNWSQPAAIVPGGAYISVASQIDPVDSAWAMRAKVRPYAVYRLSGEIRTENVLNSDGGKGALLNVHEIDGARTAAVTGTHDWTEVSTEFQTDGQQEIQVNCLLGGWGRSTGGAWYRNVKLELVKELAWPSPVPEDWTPSIRIDANQRGTDISPYVYGQFIEHLGRCIYGGIWAEVLEDRKFYEEVGTDASPWKILFCNAGIPKVRMNTDEPLAGKWSPVLSIQQYGCIYQGVTLRGNMDYVGYVYLRSPGFKSFSEQGGAEVWVEFNEAGAGYQKVSAPLKFEAPTDGFVKCEFRLPLTERELPERLQARFCIGGWGDGTLEIGCVSLMPADNIFGMRADTLAALKELDSPVYRWPGGNFVSGYDWRDGIGDRDRRPPRKNPAWTGIEHNDFGLDEFMVFCRYLGTEPYIAVNTGAGQVDNAVRELEYANAPADSEMGKLRAQNGHPEPYAVKFWGIGNEMFGNWQIGHMPVEDYVRKHNEFYERFKAFDPNLVCIGVGAVGGWNEVFIPGAFDHLDALSEHIYDQERGNIVQHTQLVAESIDRVATAHAEYRQRWPELYAKKDLRIVMDEWNYWYGPHVFGELGTRYYQKDGLGIAAGLHAFFRHSDLYYMANYAQTVNVIGAVKTSPTAARLESTGLVLKLYRQHFGTTPVSAEVVSQLRFPKGVLDVSAALAPEKNLLTVSFVNATPREIRVRLDVQNLSVSETARRFVISDRDNDPFGFNDPDQPSRIAISGSEVTLTDGTLVIPPLSVTLFELPMAGKVASDPR